MKSIEEIKGMSSETIEALCLELEIRLKNGTIDDFNKEILLALIEYGRLVILSRAFPSVADGLKPVHRRILYTMKDLGLNDGPHHVKSAKITGSCLGSFHPHGDASVYDAMVRLAQEFSLRVPLVSGQGNFGTIEGDVAASARYTEATFTKAGYAFFNDINKNVVNFIPNYDETTTEPELLPVPFPNLLINGSFGIAVGMSSNIPPHNPKEIAELTKYLIEKRKGKEFDIEKALDILPAPDFPTKGIIYSKTNLRAEMKKALLTGKAKLTLRSSYEIEVNKKKESLIITDIPYMVQVPQIFTKLSEYLTNKDNIREWDIFKKSIYEIRNESNKDGVRLVIDLKAGVSADTIYSMLQDALETTISYRCNVIGLDGKLKSMGVLEILENFIDFRLSIQERKYTQIKSESEDALEITEGYIKAVDMIDTIISIIRGSDDVEQAGLKIKELGFTDRQTSVILALRLSRLTKMEKINLLSEKDKLEKLIAKADKILKSETLKLNLISEELSDLSYFDCERKTAMGEAVTSVGIVENYICSLSKIGYLKKEISNKEKGSLIENDYLKFKVEANSSESIIALGADGVAYGLKVSNIPDKDTFISLELEGCKNIVGFLKYNENDLLTFVTKRGFIKKVKVSDFSGCFRKGGIAAISLDDDELIYAGIAEGIISLISEEGKIIRFDTGEVPVVGRSARGVIAMRDATVCCVAFEKVVYYFDGKVEGVMLDKYPTQKRAGKGVYINKSAPKTKVRAFESDKYIIKDEIVEFKEGLILKEKDVLIDSYYE